MEENIDIFIICGGLGKRLRQVTKQNPKILTVINNETILEYQIEMFKFIQKKRFILATSYLSEKIIDFIKTHDIQKEVVLSHSDSLLGTRGAIKKAIEDHSPISSVFFVLYGDVLCKINPIEMLQQFPKNSNGLILTTFVQNTSGFGTLIFNEKMKITEYKKKANIIKPGFVDGGVYIFNKNIISSFPKNKIFSLENEVLQKLINLYGFKYDGPWIDAGTPSRLTQAKKIFNKSEELEWIKQSSLCSHTD